MNDEPLDEIIVPEISPRARRTPQRCRKIPAPPPPPVHPYLDCCDRGHSRPDGDCGLIQKWLWMRQLHYLGVFWTLLSVRWAMFGVAFVCAFGFLWINFRFAAKTIQLCTRQSIDRVAFVDAPSNPRKFNIDINPKVLTLLIGVACRYRFPAICAGCLLSMGHLPPFPLRWTLRIAGSALQDRRRILSFSSTPL